jgi:hypothetical protein
MSTKRTPPEQIMKELAEQARDDEMVEELASKSDAELDRELAAAGIDVEKEKAEAQAFRQKLEKSVAERRARLAAKGQADARRKPRSLRRRPLAAIVAASVAAASAGGVIVARIGPSIVTKPPNAAEIRREGLDACKARSWQHCLEKLDSARELDPEGDRAGEVQEARRAADEALHPR